MFEKKIPSLLNRNVANKILTSKKMNEFAIAVFMYESRIGNLPEFFIIIIKHIEMYIIEKLEMLMFFMYHMRDLTSEN